MKHGKKPSVRQCKILQAKRLDPDNWLIERETPDEMVIVHRYGNTKRIIKKSSAAQ